jgi:50S ribosomal protein L16 3-hydroxylase
MTTARFLASHWQKKPLLVRGAFPGFIDPLAPAEVLDLATTDDVPSREIRREGRRWHVAHGPFARSHLARRPKRNWTVLVQDTNFVSARARALLARFDFIPHARIDDLMVSYAEPGGTVGPHVDSYDVFLIQGSGRRRWQVSRQRDLAFVPGLDLKILARFAPEETWTLEPGDMLYLPPGVAHHGVALERCLTWSVGFRAPSNGEFAGGFLDHLADRLSLPGQYRDPGLSAARHPGEVPAALVDHVAQTLRRIRWTRKEVADFVGTFLSEPKNHAVFTPRDEVLTGRAFASALRRRGARLDGRSRLLIAGSTVFLNGEACSALRASMALLRELADRRALPPGLSPAATVLEWLHDAYREGALHLGEETST